MAKTNGLTDALSDIAHHLTGGLSGVVSAAEEVSENILGGISPMAAMGSAMQTLGHAAENAKDALFGRPGPR